MDERVTGKHNNPSGAAIPYFNTYPLLPQVTGKGREKRVRSSQKCFHSRGRWLSGFHQKSDDKEKSPRHELRPHPAKPIPWLVWVEGFQAFPHVSQFHRTFWAIFLFGVRCEIPGAVVQQTPIATHSRLILTSSADLIEQANSAPTCPKKGGATTRSCPLLVGLGVSF